MKKAIWIALAVALGVLALVWVRHSQQSEALAIPDTLIIGTTADYQPLSFIKEGKIVGYDIDIMQEIANRLNKEIEIKDLPFETLIPQLQAGEIHIIAAGITITDERAKLINFSTPYLTSDPLVALTPKSTTPLVSTEELSGKQVIIIPGYTAEQFLANIPGVTLKHAGTLTDAVTMLADGQGRVLVTAAATLKPILEQYGPDKFSTFVIKEINENIALGIAKERSNLLKEVNDALVAMERDGTLDTIKKKWDIA